MKKLKKIYPKSQKINLFITLLILSLSLSCKKEKIVFDFEEGKEVVCYNIVFKTEHPPTSGNTYVFRKNGEAYHFVYHFNEKKAVRKSVNNDFFSPEKWKSKEDSLFFYNSYYKVDNLNGNLILSRKNHDSIRFYKIKDTFEIEFFKNEDFSYKTYKNDTIGKFRNIRK